MDELSVEQVKRGELVRISGRACIPEIDHIYYQVCRSKGQLWGVIIEKQRWGAIDCTSEFSIKITDLPISDKDLLLSVITKIEKERQFHPWPTERQHSSLVRKEHGSSCLWQAFYLVRL